MASGPSDANAANSMERRRLGDINKVYTRKFKGRRNNKNNNYATAAAAAEPAAVTDDTNKRIQYPDISNGNAPEPSTQTPAARDEKSLQQQQTLESPLPQQERAVQQRDRLGVEEGVSRGETARKNYTGTLTEVGQVVMPPQPSGNEAREANEVVRHQRQSDPELGVQVPVVSRFEDRVRINVPRSRSSGEIRQLMRKLENELGQVRSLFKKLEAKEIQLTAFSSSTNSKMMISNVDMLTNSNSDAYSNFSTYSQPLYMSNKVAERRILTRVNSEVGSVGYQEKRPFSRSLSVSVVENYHGVGEFTEREKRTPKANQYYRNSDFLLGKDRLPPESNKKLKLNGAGRKHNSEVERRFGFGSDKHRERVFRGCGNLLQRLMKHNYGWVFNEPVDVKKLGLRDYHDIIKHPMDLATIKTRLSQYSYKSPREFAEDVRLVFHNAMTYNPKGQDVHVMAEALLKIFEERWTAIETEYNPNWRYRMYHDAGLPFPTGGKTSHTQFYSPAPAAAPTSALAPASTLTPALLPANVSIPVTPVPQVRTLDQSESMTTPLGLKLKPSNSAYVVRTPTLKKPKAKDPNKRNMTYEEKQKLSTKLQSLPSEKLDALVQIIKKRNSTLNQHNDEIEVDIDSVDAETLWELDRFVTNYKKSLSKNKRKAEVALQARARTTQMISATNSAAVVVGARKESGIGESIVPPPLVETEKPGDNASRSSSSSSSTSDSGSSSSDSDSDSSSAYQSDAVCSPRT